MPPVADPGIGREPDKNVWKNKPTWPHQASCYVERNTQNRIGPDVDVFLLYSITQKTISKNLYAIMTRTEKAHAYERMGVYFLSALFSKKLGSISYVICSIEFPLL